MGFTGETGPTGPTGPPGDPGGPTGPSGIVAQGIVNLFDSVTWIEDPPSSSLFYADFSLSQTLYTDSNVMATMINASDIALAASCWIIDVTPNPIASPGELRIWLASQPNGPLFASWIITDPGTPPL
jgi:hypothetical protein